MRILDKFEREKKVRIFKKKFTRNFCPTVAKEDQTLGVVKLGHTEGTKLGAGAGYQLNHFHGAQIIQSHLSG